MNVSKQELIDREERWGRTAGSIGLAGIVIAFGVALLGFAPEFRDAGDSDAAKLEAFPGESGEVLIQLLSQAIGLLCFVAPLVFLYRAAQARSLQMRPGLIGLAIVGPVFFAAALISTYLAFDVAAETFNEPGNAPAAEAEREEYAEELFRESSEAGIAGGLQLAAIMALVFTVIYTSLHAMRTGLLTRFWGTLGMALGAGTLFIGPPALFAFVLAISLIVAGFWPGGRPPAWEAGEAIPWEAGAGRGPDDPPPPEETARPEDFEGTGTELDASEDQARPGRRDNRKKRKRKKRK